MGVNAFGSYLGLALLSMGAAEGAEPLMDDFSSAELAVYAMSLEPGAARFSYHFSFPTHATTDRVWGIDVSHHQGDIDWSKIPPQGVSFAYVKASEGGDYFDPRFEENWTAMEALGDVGFRRGAYHFLSAGRDGDDQAENFLGMVGELGEGDLSPCVDIEWDFQRSGGRVILGPDGKPFDRWSRLSPEQIVEKLSEWLTLVEERTGRQPIIYTNANWWRERIGDAGDFTDYRLWIADYSSKSLGREVPSVPPSYVWHLWQLTDSGRLTGGGVVGAVDTNVFSGTPEEFFEVFGD